MSAVTIDLPFPISANGLFANVKGRGRVRSKRYTEWAHTAGWMLQSQRPAHVAGPFVLCLVVQRKDNRRRDLSNLVKSVEDLLVHHDVIDDDSLAERIHLTWGDAPEGCRVTVQALSEVQQ